MAAALLFLARRRWAGVALAILVECALLLPLAWADPSSVVGLPAVVAASIGGTVAVVFGPLDGAVVALSGAVLFGVAAGWGAGALAALVVWPAIVAAAGLFARRVESQRRALARFVTDQEAERRRISLELHDETAQVLSAALLELTRAEESGASQSETRELIRETIARLRALAVELRPKALDDFGLDAALRRLATGFAERTGTVTDVELSTGDDRLPPETELAAYRAVQEVLSRLDSSDGGAHVRVVVNRTPADLRIVIDRDEPDGSPVRPRPVDLVGLRERIRLAGGRVVSRTGACGTSVRVELPL